jgi:hypothetical protein
MEWAGALAAERKYASASSRLEADLLSDVPDPGQSFPHSLRKSSMHNSAVTSGATVE